MDTRFTERNRVLKGVVFTLALGFLMLATAQVQASVVVRAKVGPVSVRVGNAGWNYGHGGSAHVYRVSRHRRGPGVTVIVARPRYRNRDTVWVPGHYVIKRNGHRKWVRGHYVNF